MTEHAEKFKSRLTLLALIVVFVAPVVLAYGAFLGAWFTPASTNKGTLLSPAPKLPALALNARTGAKLTQEQLRGRWSLLYLNGTHCASVCEHNLYTLHQIWKALGKEQLRVAPVFASLSPTGLEAVSAKVTPAFSELLWADGPGLAADIATQMHFNVADERGRLYIVDPQGTIALTYELAVDPKVSAKIGKDVLSDLKLLLKLSNIG